jgi:hypothetical protein
MYTSDTTNSHLSILSITIHYRLHHSVYYGPDSIYGEFETDSCSDILGLPTCALWKPDSSAFIKLMTHQAPAFFGGWCLVGIVAASMSTAMGAILAMGTVMAHNVARQFDGFFPGLVTPDNLLLVSRIATVPFTIISTLIATVYRQNKPAGATGYLLIVAFDIVFGTVVVPLFGCFYAKKPSPRAALISILGGAITRITLEFALPKDGSLLLPYNSPEFYDVGMAASTGTPIFFDVPVGDQWDNAAEPCMQEQFKDFTGVDSIAGFLVSLILFTSIQLLEHLKGGPLFTFPGGQGYEKESMEDKGVQDSVVVGDTTKHTAILDSSIAPHTEHEVDDTETPTTHVKDSESE